MLNKIKKYQQEMSKKEKIQFSVFVGAVVFVMLLVSCLVCLQCTVPGTGAGKYASDTLFYFYKTKYTAEGLAIEYSLVYMIFSLFHKMVDSWMGATLLCAAFMAFCVGSMIVLTMVWYALFYQKKPNARIYFFSVSSVFVTMIFTRYQDALSANVWHNPTQMVSRPLSAGIIFCMYFIFKAYKSGKIKHRYFVWNAVFAMLSMAAKPSFLSAFLPALCLCLLVELIRTKGKTFLFSLRLGLSFVPSVIVLGFQYIKLFGSNSDGGAKTGVSDSSIVVGMFDSWERIMTVVLGSSVFVVFGWLLLCFYKQTDKKILTFTGCWYIIALLICFLFHEIGERADHGNFEWGYILMLYFLFVFVAGELFIKPAPTHTKKIPAVLHKLAFGLYMLHLLFGINYFVHIMSGASYL